SGQISELADQLSGGLNDLSDSIADLLKNEIGKVDIGLASVTVKDVKLNVDLQAALESALEEELSDSDSAIRIDFSEGALILDLAKLVKDSQPDDKFYGTLNGLDPNTEIVDPQLIQAALDGAIGTLLDQIPAAAAEAIEDALNSTEITIDIEVSLLGSTGTLTLDGTLGQLLGTEEPALQFEAEGTGAVGAVLNLLKPVLNETVLPLIQNLVKEAADAIKDPGALDTVFRPIVEAIRDAVAPVFEAVAENLLSILVNVQEEPGEFTHPGAGAEDAEGG